MASFTAGTTACGKSSRGKVGGSQELTSKQVEEEKQEVEVLAQPGLSAYPQKLSEPDGVRVPRCSRQGAATL